MLVAFEIVSGRGLGSMYGLLALGFHVTLRGVAEREFCPGLDLDARAVLCFTFLLTVRWPLTARGFALSLLFSLCGAW